MFNLYCMNNEGSAPFMLVKYGMEGTAEPTNDM